MKLYIGIIFIYCLVFSATLKAQEPVFIPSQKDSADNRAIPLTNDAKLNVAVPPSPQANQLNNDSVKGPVKYGWLVDKRTGGRIMTNVDKDLINFHQSSLTDGQGIAIGYLANLGSPAQSKIFFERDETGVYPFLDAFSYYYKKPEDVVFLNTKIPYTNIMYQSGGGRTNKEERLKTELSLNVGKKFNIGMNIDYIYSRGFYGYLSNKQVTYDLYSSYISDKYQMHVYFANNYYNNSENGGIEDERYITDPNNPELDELGANGGSKEIPVNVTHLWNKLKGKQLFISNKYNIGYDREYDDYTSFIPVASFILTTHYTDQKRQIASKDETSLQGGMTQTDLFYYKTYENYAGAENSYLVRNLPIHDEMAYWSFKNTFAISLNEGFRDWVKFGLTAFVEQDFRKFSYPHDEIRMPMIVSEESQNSTVIGGILNKQKGRYLRYNLKADLGVAGYNMGEFRIEGDISTTLRLLGKDAIVTANGYVKNLKPTFYENKFRTKYIQWDNDFSNIRRVYAGGEIEIPYTKTRISGGVETIDNYIYYQSDLSDYTKNKQIAQAGKNIQVVAFRLDQKLKTGILHWDNQIAYQMSSEKEYLPLPTLSLYSNLYIVTKLANVLDIQLGVDVHYHTKYYAPGYDPVLLNFYNQKETKIGGFPIATGYMNLNLKNTRFFLMMYNIAESMGNSEYFSLPNYPVNPMVFKFGLSWDFNN